MVAVPLPISSQMVKMKAIYADSTSVGSASLLTLSGSSSSLLTCATLCNADPQCLAFSNRPLSCKMVNVTMLNSTNAGGNSLLVYFTVPTATAYTTDMTLAGLQALAVNASTNKQIASYVLTTTRATPASNATTTNNTTQTGSTVPSITYSWSAWTNWTYCPVSCGGGTQSRNRTLMLTYSNGTQVAYGNGTTQTATQTCHNFTCSCKTTSGTSCVFPWTYSKTGSTSYSGCSMALDTAAWCPTKLNSAGTYVSGGTKWGYCNANCPSCMTVDGGSLVGVNCYFPFTYNGTTYNACTTVNNGANNCKAWCATVAVAVVVLWGICDDARLCPNGN